MSTLKSSKHPKLLKNKWENLSDRLRMQLSHFGLNPRDWNLILNSRQEEKQELHFDLIHRFDRSYRLKGTAQVVEFLIYDRPAADRPFTAFWKEIRSNLNV